MRCPVFLLVYFFIGHYFGQVKTPFIFRAQDKQAIKHIRHYLPHDTMIETGGAKIHIHYSKKSDKPYLLLLHGLGANARTNWSKQVAYLSQRFNLLVPDLIYFGESTAKTDNFSVEFQAEQIHQVLQLLNVKEKINVLGFSYGGLLAAIYNQLYFQEVNKLVIIDGPVKYYSGQLADSIAVAAGADNITNLIVPQNVADFDAMRKAVISKKIFISGRLKRKIIAHYFMPSRFAKQQLLKSLIDNQVQYQTYNYRIDSTPTLLIWGARDGVVPVSVGIALKKHFPESTQLIIFGKAKHDVHFRNAKKLNKAVTIFLQN